MTRYAPEEYELSEEGTVICAACGDDTHVPPGDFAPDFPNCFDCKRWFDDQD